MNEKFAVVVKSMVVNYNPNPVVKTTTDFAGHRRTKEKVRALMHFPEPKTAKQIQGFLCLTGFFRKYFEFYAQIAASITSLLKNNTDFNLSIFICSFDATTTG